MNVSMDFNIISYNIRGLGTEGRDTAIGSVVKIEKAAVIFIQETKMENMTDSIVRSIWGSGMHQWTAVNSIGASRGMLTVWDDSIFNCVEVFSQMHCLSIRGTRICDGFDCVPTKVYGPTGDADRTRIWSELDEVRLKWPDLPWCIGGDFNVFRVASEKNTPSDSDLNMRRFDCFLRRHELCDLPLNGGLFTWSNMQTSPVLCRLDRFVVSGEWEDKFPLMAQCVLTRTVSDHSPLSLRSGGIVFGPFPFKVEIFWFEHSCFKELMFFWWNSMCFGGSPSFIFAKKLQMLKPNFKSWSKEVFGNLDKKLRELEVLIDIIDKREEVATPISEVEFIERASLRRLYNEVLLLITKRWKSRAKTQWLVDGERNSKIFHKITNDHQRRNAIFKLKIEEEEVVCQDHIKKEVIEFYEKLYSRDQAEFVQLDEFNFSSISEIENIWIEREISEDEILPTISSFKLNKSPGPDKFPIEFYRASWDVIKEDFMKVVDEFNEKGGVDWRLNCTFLSLIPKKNAAIELKDFRPISLVSTIYKILSKVLANRLKVVMPNLISQSQGAFLSERQILDGIYLLLTNLLVQEKEKEKKELCASWIWKKLMIMFFGGLSTVFLGR